MSVRTLHPEPAPQTPLQVAVVELAADLRRGREELSPREFAALVDIGLAMLARTAIDSGLDSWRRAA